MKNLEVLAQNQPASSMNKPPTYREYQKFLTSYNEGRSDHGSASPSLSTTSSTSSVPSMLSEGDNAPLAFNEYLQKYAGKKYSTVRPNLPKKNVKTEIFIQVNNGEDSEGLQGRKFNTLKSRRPPGKVLLARHNSLNRPENVNAWKSPPLSPAGHLVTLSPPPPKQEVVPDEMIYAKTAVLHELGARLPKLNKVPSPELKHYGRVCEQTPVSNETRTASPPAHLPPPPTNLPPPPPPKLPDFTNCAPPVSVTVKKVTPLAKSAPKPNSARPSFISEMQSRFNENSPINNHHFITGKYENGFKKPQALNESVGPSKFVSNHEDSRPSHTETDSAICHLQSVKISSVEIPPPLPKCPPPSHNGKHSPPMTNGAILPPPPKFMQHPKTLDLEPNPTTYVPVSDNTTGVDKNNPNVKKLVYNTYRGLLGAYNNKANNVVSMPKNRVVQDQGVSKQLESIELQGCLDKLNGRINPSAENE